MGKLCSCCSRGGDDIDTDTIPNDETQSMLNTSSKQQNIKNSIFETDDQKQFSPKISSGYGATDSSPVEYTPLKSEKHTAKKLEKEHRSKKEAEVASQINEEHQHQNINNQLKNKQFNGIPVGEPNLVIDECGYAMVNGDYRWFVHDKKWCLFSDAKDQHYSIENGVDVEMVYNQLKKLQASNMNFKWDKPIKKCFILSDIDSQTIYYAAPQENDKYIPDDQSKWISVHGSNPGPSIYHNLVNNTNAPDQDEQFGNRSMSNTKSFTMSNKLQSIEEFFPDKDDQNVDDDEQNNNEDEDEDASDVSALENN